MRKALFFLLCFLAPPALAGTTTLNYSPSGASPMRQTTDGSSNNLPNFTIWDYSAGANGLAIGSDHNLTCDQGGAASSGPWVMTPWIGGAVNSSGNPLFFTIEGTVPLPTGAATLAAQSLSPSITNPSSVLTLTSATTAYAAGYNIASSATAGSIVVPSFAIATSSGSAHIPTARLISNDATSTAWPGVTVQVDLWSAAPTFTNGNGAAYAVATGSAGYLGSFYCTFAAAEAGDGNYAVCLPTRGSAIDITLASGTTVYWSSSAVTASGTLAASKTLTLEPEIWN